MPRADRDAAAVAEARRAGAEAQPPGHAVVAAVHRAHGHGAARRHRAVARQHRHGPAGVPAAGAAADLHGPALAEHRPRVRDAATDRHHAAHRVYGRGLAGEDPHAAAVAGVTRAHRHADGPGLAVGGAVGPDRDAAAV